MNVDQTLAYLSKTYQNYLNPIIKLSNYKLSNYLNGWQNQKKTHMVLHFGFELQTVLITHQYFSCFFRVSLETRSFLFLTLPKKGDSARTADANWTKEYPIILCLTVRAGRKKEEGGWTFTVM